MDRRDRMRLMKFVCSFAWADLEVRPEERAFVAGLIERLGLDDEEVGRVTGWLQTPPPPDAIDPTDVPREHRQVFLDAVQGVVAADGHVAPEERENLDLFRDLLT
jgi:hypothetical protein